VTTVSFDTWSGLVWCLQGGGELVPVDGSLGRIDLEDEASWRGRVFVVQFAG
jgi:hypothetical protein